MTEAQSELIASEQTDVDTEATNTEMDRAIAADPEATIESLPEVTGSPDAYRDMAEAVNPISGAVSSSSYSEPALEPSLQQPTTASGPVVTPSTMSTIAGATLDSATSTVSVYKTRLEHYWEQLQPVIREYGGVTSLALLVLGVTILGFILLATILTFIDFIPLASATLKLIGFGYTLWFISRYLLFDRSRKELAADFQSFKQQIIGS